MAKPFRLDAGTLAATDTATTFTAFKLPSTLLNQTVFLDKVKGFVRWRGKMVFTLQVNSTKFHAGVYKLTYVPTAGTSSALTKWDDWVNAHYLTQQQRSQLPGVEIDVATQTQVTLEIPWLSPYNNGGIGSSYGAFTDTCSLRLCPFSPLALGAGQDSTIGYTLWGHFEDVELDMPAYPQSGYDDAHKALAPMKNKQQMAAKEQESKNIGPVKSSPTGKWSTKLFEVGSIVGSAAKVPTLAPFAAPASFFLDAAACVASTFGWSKPANLDVEKKVVRDYMFNHTHFNSSDNSRVMALDERNMVEILPGFSGTDVDELSFDVFLTKPTLLTKFTWASTQPTGTALASFPVSPQHAVERTIDGLVVYCHSPMSLLADYFNLWRGDIVFTFHFVKTPMHSGRVALVFTPNVNLVNSSTTSLANSVYTLRTIVDLRDSTVVTVVIPFNASTCYRFTNQDEATSCGTLTMYVVDELVAPTTAPQTIEVLPWISAAPGFEFAFPCNSTEVPYFGLPIVATPQSGLMIGDYTPIKEENMESSRKCIGERVVSIRQMLRVGRQMKWSAAYTAATPSAGIVTMTPFGVVVAKRASGATTLPTHYGDFISMISSCFLFSRGSIRVKLYSPDMPPTQVILVGSKSTSMPFLVEGESVLPDGYGVLDQGGYCNGVNVITDNAARGGFEVTLPQYTRMHSRSNAASIVGAYNMRYDEGGSFSQLAFYVSPGLKLNILRSGGDDFNLGMFVSIPVVRSS